MNEESLFIPSEIGNAPEHPLSDGQQGERIPGIVKRIIPIDHTTFWSYWWCVPGRLLLPEDVALLQSDYARVESILTKLVWLWGGRFIGAETSKDVFDWQQVLELVRDNRLSPDVIDVDFFPLTVQAYKLQGNVAVTPAHWHIEFFQLEATRSGHKLQEPKKACGCQIWTGKPFIKQLDTGEATVRYDLSIAEPSDMTIPPWQVLSGIN